MTIALETNGLEKQFGGMVTRELSRSKSSRARATR